jgi:aryl-alcohol dehydrogenase-like predicted oxidoreductase
VKTRKIGTLDVSVVGLGCNNFGGRLNAEQTAQVLHAALDAGINFLDTADIYGATKSEEFLGQALKGRRDKAVVATKFGIKIDDERPGGAKPAYIRRMVEESLSRLQTDRIDLYQLHRPDEETPIADTLGTLNELVQAGKLREIGCSNFSVEQLREAEEAAKGGARFVSVQNEYSVLERAPEKDGVLAECDRLGLAFLPYFPLTSGLLTGKYRKGQPLPEGARINDSNAERWITEERLDTVEKLIAFAESRGHTILELAFGWLLSKSAVSSVIAGATKPEQIQANVAAVGWELTTEDLAEVERILPRLQ